MMPEIWLPTSTFTTGFNWPLAVTSCVSSPRDATAVSYRSALSGDWFRYQPKPTPQASTTRSHGRFRRRNFVDLIIRSPISFHYRYHILFPENNRTITILLLAFNREYGVFNPYNPYTGEFTNLRKSRSRRDYEAEVFFVPKSASLRRRLPPRDFSYCHAMLGSIPPAISGFYPTTKSDERG